MSFAWPWAFVGLLALPALVAIYWLRQRSRRLVVSSLMLWRDQLPSRASGRRRERFEGSRLFVLELIILTLLVLGAAGPRIATPDARRPLVVVLDDSFSMTARRSADAAPARQAASVQAASVQAASVQTAARAALEETLDQGDHRSVTLVAAGARPQVIGGGASSPEQAAEALAAWQPRAPEARIDEALALAAQLGGPRARLLVVSDHPPPGEGPDAADAAIAARVQWWAFGRPKGNVAVVNALRSADAARPGEDSCLVEIANFASQPVTLEPRIDLDGTPQPSGERLELAAGERTRWRTAVPSAATLTFRALSRGGDVLSLDDEAMLLPLPDRRVRVAIELEDGKIRRQVRSAVAATRLALPAGADPELLITDRPVAEEAANGAWRLQLVASESAVPYLGPFVMDRDHPLTAGMDLGGVIWGAAQETDSKALPVVSAGDVPLLTETVDVLALDARAVDPLRQRRLSLFWSPRQSNLQQTTNWPILWWNLLAWRGQSIPGPRASNLRLGAQTVIGLRGEDAELQLPDGALRSVAPESGQLEITAEQLGTYRLTSGGTVDRWVVNALAAAESDLRAAGQGRWGDWGQAAADWEQRPVGWCFLLLAAAGLALHLVWTGSRAWTGNRASTHSRRPEA